ncbi:hypothetical protein, partial [Rhizobium sp.]|uniref:hypothetical protein n=1 Tax=Rhizobium sp. TaxID=391 RepID=UPI0028AB9DB0
PLIPPASIFFKQVAVCDLLMTQKHSKWRASVICACFAMAMQGIAQNLRWAFGPEDWNGMPAGSGVLFDL